jgi:glutamine synthetase
LRDYISQSWPILFEGNGYSQEWVEEAAKRGLTNRKTTPEALVAYVSDKTKKLFIDHNIFNEKELEARWEIRHENYAKVIQIESRMSCRSGW